jgi:O-antigen/teichoic acid export membrane protein
MSSDITSAAEFDNIAEAPPGGPVLVLAPSSAVVEPKKPSMLFLVGSLAVGNYVSLGLRMIGGVLQARFVAPSVLGLFNGISLVQGYIPFLQLGILNGLNRELPYFIGKGDRKQVTELAAAAQAWALAVGTVVSLSLLGVAGWQFARGEFELAAGWATNAVLAMFLFYNTYYLQMTYRTSHDFARLAMAGVAENGAALALVLLVAVLGFYGLCLRALLAAVVSVTILYYWRPLRVAPHWNLQHFTHLLIIGAPIFVVGQLYGWWITLNSTLVLHYAGTEGMGLYAIVLMAGTTLDLLPLAVAQVAYPRMSEQYGRTENIHDVLRIARKPTLFAIVGMVPMIVAGWWLAEPVVRWAVPDYTAAVPAARWCLLVPLLNCLAPPINVFNVVRRQDLYVTAIVLGMATYLGSLMWLIRDGVSLIAFPQAMLIGRSVFVLACYAFVAYLRYADGAQSRNQSG